MTVGERLRFVRKVRGMPQHELASKVKLSANRIAQYETDYRVPRAVLQTMNTSHGKWNMTYPAR